VGLFTGASVAIDGSKFKAVNNRDRNFTRAKMQRRMEQIEESVARYWNNSTAPIGSTHRQRAQPRQAACRRKSRS
jgi:chromosomal replication initiation ATPase DnaA